MTTTIAPIATSQRASARLDPALARDAAQQPVDAIVFFTPVQTEQTRGAISRLQAIDMMPLGPERKSAAYDAQHAIGTATIDAHRAQLDSLVKQGLATGIDELWSANAVRIRGARLDALTSLAGPGVQQIVRDSIIAVPTVPASIDDATAAASMLPLKNLDTDRAAATRAQADADPNAIYMDWGTARMKAPAAWQQGITGAGIVIGSLDTGVDVQHPILSANYRGTRPDGTIDNDYNWKDVVKELPENGKLPDGSTFDPATDAAADGTSLRPIDLNGHGTHTSGSAVGWDAHHITGVAPDAKLITARGLGEKGGSMFALMSAMEWFMAPTKVDGSSPRPDLAPDIVTNSWGGAAVGNPMLWMSLRAWRHAGIVPVFASGNAQPTKPGEVAVPGMYPETITVGANDLDEKRAWFSMYGPSDYSNDPKPEVSAPGHWTYSSLPDGSVRDVFPVDGVDHPASGTSMATPHVAGAVALYMQANPHATYDDVLTALKASGTQAAHPDQELGWGRVQVDKLITEDSIAPDAKRTDQARVDALMAQVAKAEIYNEGVRKPGIPKRG